MTHIDELIAALDELLDPAGLRDSGLTDCRYPGATVTRVVSGVSARRELSSARWSSRAELVLVHHGLFWDFQPTG